MFSVTSADCDWQFVRGSGKGGQKRNKTSSAVRCTHRASGAVGFSENGRSQMHNRQAAFEKMAHTPEFKKWHAAECARCTGAMRKIDEWVEQQLKAPVTKVEVKDDRGRWVNESGVENEV